MSVPTIAFLLISTLLCCSEVNSLIGNVQRAEIREFPFIVSVGMIDSLRNSNGIYHHVCGGALISRRHVLTGEQCVSEQNSIRHLNAQQLRVRIGHAEYARGAPYEVESFMTFNRWFEIHEHQGQDPDDNNDIAILKLRNAVNERGVTPGRITEHPPAYFIGKIVQTAGWGVALQEDGSQHHLLQGETIPRNLVVGSPSLRKVSLRVLRPAECFDLVESAVLRRAGYPSPLYRAHLCTTGMEPFTLIAAGDEGGPLVYGNEIIGINEARVPVFVHNYDTHYQRYQRSIHLGVALYRQFIDDMLQH